MKSTLLVTSTLTLALLTACGGRPALPVESTVPTELPAPAESLSPIDPDGPAVTVSELPVLPWVAEHTAVPDFLDDDLQQLYLRANCALWIFEMNSDTVDSFPLADGSQPDLSEPYEVVTLGEDDYFISRGRYAAWADFSAMVESIFTPSLSVQLLHSGLLAPVQGDRTGFISAGRGADIFYDMTVPDSFTLLEQTEDYVVFTRTGHYSEPMCDENGNDMGTTVEYTRDTSVRLERTDGGWRVAELSLPY